MFVYVTRDILDSGIELMRSAGIDVEVWEKDTPIPRDILLSKCKDADGVLSMLSDKIDKEFFDHCNTLKVVSNYAVGYNNIDVEYAKKMGVAVGNTPDVLTDATADIAFSLLLASSRRILDGKRYIDEGRWKTWEPRGFLGPSLSGKTMGIAGFGRIGQAMAKKCHFGFDMDIIYTARSEKPDAEKKFKAKRVDFDELLAQSDFISVHTDLNDSSKGMFNYDAFKKMRPMSIFINTARGEIHNEEDLTRALKEGEIWGVGLDVTNPEPMDVNSPLLKMNNVAITPHVGSANFESRSAMSELCGRNILAGLKGEKLPATPL